MHELIFLQDMAIVMVTSAVTLVVCRYLRLPIVLGYILAGLLIGPYTPPYALVKDLNSIHTLSALGVIFLLFSIGLEFSFKKLAKVGAVAFIAATVEIIFMVGVGFSLGKAMGWKHMDCLFLGAILSISSTTIIAKILMENKKISEKFAQVILGILIVEDLWAIIMIAILSGIATTGSLNLPEISVSMIKVFIFMTGILFFGFLLVPRILRYIDRLQLNEMMVVVVLGLCLGASLLAAKTGFSIALGAFLIGAVIAETNQVHTVITKMEPIRDMFTAIFFVSVGMLIDPAVIAQFAGLIVIITLLTIVGKVISCSLATFLTGYDSRTALKVGLGLAQIGEFSFIIAQLGRDTQVTSPFLYPIAVAVSAITTISTPFLMNNADWIIQAGKHFVPKPIRTFTSLYPSWIAKFQQNEDRSSRRIMIIVEIKKHLPKLLFYMMGIAAVYFLAGKYYGKLPINESIYWLIVAAGIFPLFIGFASSLDKIFWDSLFMSILKPEGETGSTGHTQELLHNMLRFLITLTCGLVLLVVGVQIVPAIPLTASMIILTVASGSLFWRSITRIHNNMENSLFRVFDSQQKENPTEEETTQEELIDLIRTKYPISFETQDFILPPKETAVNRAIKDLNLRSLTGASIVGIFRGEESIANPDADTRLMPGDVLLLIGNADQIKSAMGFLKNKIKESVPEK